MKNNWYVITGGPCAGKTTLVQALADLGHNVQFETARLFIEEELARGKTIEQIRGDEAGFQRGILRSKVELEKSLNPDELIFFDRGMHDSQAYFEICGIAHEPELAQALTNSDYKKIFLLDMLEYAPDEARIESPELAQKIHELLKKSYSQFGDRLILVPRMSVEDRVKFIKENL